FWMEIFRPVRLDHLRDPREYSRTRRDRRPHYLCPWFLALFCFGLLQLLISHHSKEHFGSLEPSVGCRKRDERSSGFRLGGQVGGRASLGGYFLPFHHQGDLGRIRRPDRSLRFFGRSVFL